jgi:hypothetical protein
MTKDILYWTFMAAFALSFVNGYFLFQLIRQDLPSVASRLGDPTIRNVMTNTRKVVLGYIWRLKFLQERNAMLNFHCFSAIGLEILLAGAFVCMFFVR